MHEHMREVCDALDYSYRDLGEVNNQLRNNNGQFDPARMNYFNQLTHAIKSLETTKAMLEAKEEEERGEYGARRRYGDQGQYGWRMPYPPIYRGGYYEGGGYGEDYGRGERRGESRSENRDGYGRNQDRDSRGRYADEGMREKLRTMMANTRDENTRMELQRMMDNI